MVRLAPGNAEIIDHIPTGRLGLDGNRLIRLDSDSLRPRKQMIFNGAVTVTLVADAAGKLLAAPRLSVHGFPEGDDLAEIEADAVAAVAKTFEGERLRDDNSAAMLASQAVRRVFKARTGKRPVMNVQVIRI
jgi:ribonuclease J